MKISAINNNYQHNNKTNFKGTISPEVTELIKRSARAEAERYVNTLNKGVKADKEVLLGIKKAWDEVSKALKKKLKLIHPDVIINVKEQSWGSYEVYFANKNLKAVFRHSSYYRFFLGGKYDLPEIEYFEMLVKLIFPTEVNEAILRSAIGSFVEDQRTGDISKDRYKAIIKYKKNLGTISEEAKNYIAKLDKLFNEFEVKKEQEEKITEAEQYNRNILYKIFGPKIEKMVKYLHNKPRTLNLTPLEEEYAKEQAKKDAKYSYWQKFRELYG